jgi:hypothetical protein
MIREKDVATLTKLVLDGDIDMSFVDQLPWLRPEEVHEIRQRVCGHSSTVRGPRIVKAFGDPWEILPPVPIVEPDKCTCDINQLMREGCRCGALQRERNK